VNGKIAMQAPFDAMLVLDMCSNTNTIITWYLHKFTARKDFYCFPVADYPVDP
jgi:hypothetical protein